MSLPDNNYILEDGVMSHEHIVVQEFDHDDFTSVAGMIEQLRVFTARFPEGSDLTFEITYDSYEPSRPEVKLGHWRPKTAEQIAQERAQIKLRKEHNVSFAEARERATLAKLIQKYGVP